MTDYQYRPDELLVHVDDCGLIETELAGHGYRRADRHGSLRRFVGAQARRTVPELLTELRTRHGAALRVSPHHVFGCDRIIWSSMCPHITSRSLPEVTAEGAVVKVGVVDTGIVLRGGEPHPYIKGRVDFGPDDVDRLTKDVEGNPSCSDGHGTFVTGLVLREAPSAFVHMKGVIDKSTGDLEDLAVADAIDTLREEGVTLINLSFSGSTWEGSPPRAIENALLKLGRDVVVVAAAGNRGTSQPVFPAAMAMDNDHAVVVSVGAVDERLERQVATFSGHGSWVTAYARGVNVVGPYFEPDYPPSFTGWAEWSGTSFAAAIVTGRIAAAMAGGLTARAAANAILDVPEETIEVWDVNGPKDKPFVASTGAPNRL